MRSLAPWLVLACACGDSSVSVENIGSEIQWGALLAVDESGALRESSGLKRRRLDGPFVFERGARSEAELRFVGYRPGVLDDDAVDEDAPLSAAVTGAPRLPKPDLSLERETTKDGGWRPGPTIDLSAPWLPACPSLVRSGALTAIGCGFGFCQAQLSQSGCALSLDMAACGRGVLQGEVDANGQVLWQEGDLGRCTSSFQGAGLSMDCELNDEVCQVDVLAAPNGDYVAQGRLQVRSRALLDIETDVVQGLGTINGHLGGLVAQSEHVMVLLRSWPDAETCQTSTSATLALIDQTTMETVQTATAPPCLWSITAAGEGVLGVVGGGRPQLLRLTNEGRIFARADITASIDPMMLNLYFPIDVSVVETPGVKRAVISWVDSRGPRDPALVTVVDLNALSVEAVIEDFDTVLTGVSFLDEGRFAIIDDDNDQLAIYRTGGDKADALRIRPPNSFFMGDLYGLLYQQDFDRMTVSGAARNNAGMYVYDGISLGFEALSVRYAPPIERDMEPHAVVPWPPDPGLLAVGMTEREGERRAFLSLFEASGRVGFLPGSVEIGVGLVRYAKADRRGRLWLGLPWSAQLVLVTPR